MVNARAVVGSFPTLSESGTAAGVDGGQIITTQELTRRQFRYAVMSIEELELVEAPVRRSGVAGAS